MPEKENSAFRLHRFFGRMVQQKATIPTAEVLLLVFGEGNAKAARTQNALLAQVTSLLFAELDSLTEESTRLGFSEESRQPIVAAFEMFSVRAMSQAWSASIALFQGSLPALRIFGEGLADEGPAISKEDLAGLRTAVVNLREEIKKSDLPETVKRFVYQQLDIVERAIKDYPIAGINAFRTAAKDTLFNEVEHPQEVKDLGETASASKLQAIIVRVREMSRVIAAFGRLLAAGKSAVEGAEKLGHSTVEVAHQVSGVVQHLIKK
jgi:hypothetical protein